MQFLKHHISAVSFIENMGAFACLKNKALFDTSFKTSFRQRGKVDIPRNLNQHQTGLEHQQRQFITSSELCTIHSDFS